MNSVEGQATRMRPHVICHMTSSIDGRSLVPLWQPEGVVPDGLWDHAKRKLDTDAGIMGRITGQEYQQGTSYPDYDGPGFPREDHLPAPGADNYTIVLDPHGVIAWGRSDINGNPIIVALPRSVSDQHLAGLRSDGVYYLFCGETELDLRVLLGTLGRDLGIRRLRLGGGPATTGQFLHAGLIDEISLLLLPALDGYSGAPTIVEYTGDRDHDAFPVEGIDLISSDVLDGGVLWLRYSLRNASPNRHATVPPMPAAEDPAVGNE